MSHTFAKIWIHAVWSTKERQPFIKPEIENILFDCMEEQFRELDCPIRIINGMPDHVHCLFLLNAGKSVADVIKYVKGTSSHFINQNNITLEKFSWQTGYGAFSVSESVVDRVFNYVKNQKQHHSIKTFGQEFDDFIDMFKS